MLQFAIRNSRWNAGSQIFAYVLALPVLLCLILAIYKIALLTVLFYFNVIVLRLTRNGVVCFLKLVKSTDVGIYGSLTKSLSPLDTVRDIQMPNWVIVDFPVGQGPAKSLYKAGTVEHLRRELNHKGLVKTMLLMEANC